MVNYQKYMFDDFIVKVNDDKKDDDYTCNVEEVEEVEA